MQNKKSKAKKTIHRDPTPEEIWGPSGLAERERMRRPEEVERSRSMRLIMLPYGRGKLLGN
jgi:hypothetical protein